MLYELVSPQALHDHRAAFTDLLVASVNAGAGIGFLAPLGEEKADAYWQGVATELDVGHRLLFAARDGPALVGSVQLDLATRETGLHRAEIQKLMVHPKARRQGIAKALMGHAEAAALARGRTLLMLDTFEGTVADGMYRRWGWTVVGKVPSYAVSPEGDLKPLVLFYKELGPHAPPARPALP